MQFVLAIDQGTTSTRASLFDVNGQCVQSFQRPLTQYFPKPGWVEQDPEEIWLNVQDCCAKLIAAQDIRASDLLGIGITNQRETTILWDKLSGQTLSQAIVWQDRRTADYCLKLKQQGRENIIHDKTGLMLDPYFSATKINWLLQSLKHSFENKNILFGTVESYLLWKFTGTKVHATDITNASRTLLFNIKEQQWDPDLLNLFDIPEHILPEVKDNCAHFGETQILFDRPVRILAMMGDQQAAMIGQGCLYEGEAKCTYGTGSFLMVNTGKDLAVVPNMLNTVSYRINGQISYATEGSVFAAGTIIKWLRDQMQFIKSAEQSAQIAQSLTSNDGVYLVPAFTGLGAPYWQPDARAAIFGMTQNTKPAHIVRAGLEAMAYQTKDLLRSFSLKELQVDGGVTNNDWLLQFLADILQMPIIKSKQTEATSAGIAYLTLLAAGKISNLDSVRNFIETGVRIEPKMPAEKAAQYYDSWLNAVGHTLTNRL